MQNKKNAKLSVLIPVFNEGINLNILLRILKPMINVSHDILVVHDIPDDNSIPVVKKLQKEYPELRLVYNKLGRGVVNAVKAGVAEAKGEYVLIIAADDIGPAFIINDMAKLMDEGCDLVNATRYAYGGKNVGGLLLSRWISTIVNKMFYVLSGSSLTDPTFGVKMFKRKRFKEMNLESRPVGWAFSFEFAIKAQIRGWNLGEVPLISLNRLYGHGKSSFRLSWAKEYTRWFLYGMGNLLFSNNKRNKVMVRVPDKISSK